jgi:hypothetical protein
MPQDNSPPQANHPFLQRLVASLIIFLIPVVLFGGFGVVLLLTPDDKSQLPGAKLPARSTLLEIEGKIVAINYVVGGTSARPRQFTRPVAEYTLNGASHQIGTVNVYSPDSHSFQAGQVTPVLVSPGDPQTAWLKWEYDRFMEELNRTTFGDVVRAVFFYGGLGVIGLTGLFVLLNLFGPLLQNSGKAA